MIINSISITSCSCYVSWVNDFIYRPKKTLNSKKYGVDLICYTHAVNTALHSSTKVDGIYFIIFFFRGRGGGCSLYTTSYWRHVNSRVNL